GAIQQDGSHVSDAPGLAPGRCRRASVCEVRNRCRTMDTGLPTETPRNPGANGTCDRARDVDGPTGLTGTAPELHPRAHPVPAADRTLKLAPPPSITSLDWGARTAAPPTDEKATTQGRAGHLARTPGTRITEDHHHGFILSRHQPRFGQRAVEPVLDQHRPPPGADARVERLRHH